jgi:Tfp pilus assembly protein PilV
MTRPLPSSFLRTVVVLIAAVTMLLGVAGPAAAATRAEKLAVLSSWTQTSATSYAAWNAARTNRGSWADYNFDWSTDYCTSSPDNPLGFNFRLSCYRHDFGYRNYTAMGVFSANKDRVDNAFYADLKRVCATYSAILRPACYSLAWTYYSAVHVFGSLTAVRQADVDRAARIRTESLRAAAA